MTIQRIWVSTQHSVEQMIEARERGVDLGTALDPWDGVVVILSRERELATSLCQAIRQAGMGALVSVDTPGGDFRTYSRRRPYSMRVEGRGRPPEFLLDFGAHLHRDDIRKQLDAVLATQRQTFLTTMNPAVLDMLEFASAEHVRRSFIFATAEGARHMGASANLWAAYRRGTRHVSELMEDGGLW